MREVWEKGPLHRQGWDRACQSWGASHLGTRWGDLEAGMLHKCWTWPCCCLVFCSCPVTWPCPLGWAGRPLGWPPGKPCLGWQNSQDSSGTAMESVMCTMYIPSLSPNHINLTGGEETSPYTLEHLCLSKTLSAEIPDFRLLLLEAVGKQTLQS